jgi:hypothetical protein
VQTAAPASARRAAPAREKLPGGDKPEF